MAAQEALASLCQLTLHSVIPCVYDHKDLCTSQSTTLESACFSCAHCI